MSSSNFRSSTTSSFSIRSWGRKKMYEEQRGLAMPSYATHKFWFGTSWAKWKQYQYLALNHVLSPFHTQEVSQHGNVSFRNQCLFCNKESLLSAHFNHTVANFVLDVFLLTSCLSFLTSPMWMSCSLRSSFWTNACTFLILPLNSLVKSSNLFSKNTWAAAWRPRCSIATPGFHFSARPSTCFSAPATYVCHSGGRALHGHNYKDLVSAFSLSP